MARLTLYATAGSNTVSFAAQEELVAVFEAALATLVADAESPTQGHVTAVDAAYTDVKAIWTQDYVLDYERDNISTDDLKHQAARAIMRAMTSIT